MQIFLFTFLVLLLAFFGMAMGVILNNRELKGSCGGLSNIRGINGDCSCASPCEKRKAKMAKEQKLNNKKAADQQYKYYDQINLGQLKKNIKK